MKKVDSFCRHFVTAQQICDSTWKDVPEHEWWYGTTNAIDTIMFVTGYSRNEAANFVRAYMHLKRQEFRTTRAR